MWSAAPGPTSSPAPASYVRRLRPASRRRPPARRSQPSAAVSCGPARPRRRRRRVRLPLQSHHVRHPGLRHRETRSRPAEAVGAQRVSRSSAPAAGPGCRPEAWSGHDSLPGAPLARRVFLRRRLCYPPQGLGTPWAFIRGPAGRPPLNGPQIGQRHSNIQSLSVLRPARAQSLPLPATWGPGGERAR